MKIEMYKIFYEIQKKHWWFVVKKQIIIDIITRYLPKNINMKILDIGCGSGLMLNALESFGETYGMDASDDAVEFSKLLFSGVIKKGALPEVVPYQENYFNLIIALDVIEHIDRDFDSLKILHRLLVKNGKVVITVPAYMFLWSPFDEINEHKRRYTIKELKLKLIMAGFTIEKISYYNMILFPIIFLVRKINNLLRRDGTSDMKMPIKSMNLILKNIFSIEKYLLKFMNLPFGVSIIAVVKK